MSDDTTSSRQELDDVRRTYADRRPRSRALTAEAAAVQPGGNTRSVLDFKPFPFRVAHAENATLIDVDGFGYVDLLGDYSAGILGHSNPAVRGAIERALADGWSLGAVHEREVRLAELIVERFPGIDKVRFTNSGTEATLMSLLTARHHTGRPLVAVCRAAYHGGMLYFGHGGEPLRAPFDYVFMDYNRPESVAEMFAAHGSRIAAAIVEPMMGSAGCIAAQHEFLTSLRDHCSANGSLLVFDEVMTSRLSVGGAQLRYGVIPDLTALGKYLGGGMTFGAFGGRADVMQAYDPAAGGDLTHGGTFNNNVITCAGGIAALTDVLTAANLDPLNDRGDRLRERLNDLFTATGANWYATGIGSFIGLHPVRGPVAGPDDLAAADPVQRELLFHHVLAAGYYMAARGYIALSLPVTDDDLEGFVAAVETFITG